MYAAIVDTDVVSMLFKGDTRALAYRPHIIGRLLWISFMTLAEFERPQDRSSVSTRLTAFPRFRNGEHSGLVRAREEHPAVVDNADAQSVKPTRPAYETPIERGVVGKKNERRKLDAESVKRDLVFIGHKRACHGSKTLRSS
jgi:hypothetical protein